MFTKCSGDDNKEDEMGGTCRIHGADEKSEQRFFSIPTGKTSLARRRCRWEDNI
jgi:hypothetical protein